MSRNQTLKTKAPPQKRMPLLIGLLLTVAILAVYGQTVRHDFILFDDDVYVYDNPHVSTGLNLSNMVWAFTAGHSCNWHPLTWLSHQADCQVYGLRPGGHHLTNVLFHVLNSLLLFYFLIRWTKALGPSALTAFLFALHPLHVESVAWIAERKDVLSTFFWLLTMLAYVRYVEQPGYKRYLPVAVFLALGLMAKPMLVSLPLVLLLLDYWPLARTNRALAPHVSGGDVSGGTLNTVKDPRLTSGAGVPTVRPGVSRGDEGKTYRFLVMEKVPLFFMVAASCVVTQLVHQHGGAVKSFEVFPLSMRVGNALLTYFEYLVMMVWPRGLSIFYPYPGHLPVWQTVGAGLALVALTVLAVRWRRRCPYVLTGWLWYLITLVPVVGLVQVGLQAMADRYTYIPLIGIFIAIAWGLAEFAKAGKRWPVYLKAGAGLSLIVLTVLTGMQVHRWQNSVTLFTHGLTVTKGNDLLHCNLGCVLNRAGRTDEALDQYFAAMRIKPNNGELRNTLGVLLAARGRLNEAVEQFHEALRLRPGRADYHIGLGAALDRLGRPDEAMAEFSAALRIDPHNAMACYNCGVLMVTAKKWEKAVGFFCRALEAKPDYPDPRVGLALAFYNQGEYAQAWEQVHQCRRCGREPPADLVKILSQRMPEPR